MPKISNRALQKKSQFKNIVRKKPCTLDAVRLLQQVKITMKIITNLIEKRKTIYSEISQIASLKDAKTPVRQYKDASFHLHEGCHSIFL